LPPNEKHFPWGLWALLGVVAWVIAMIAVGLPIFIFLAPAAGVILGWLAGGLVYVLVGALSVFRARH
jgi:hypothetical protein